MDVPENVHEMIDELANSLQTAVLSASALEDQLRGSQWTKEAEEVYRAVRRAARAAFRLRRWAQTRH